MGKVRNISFPSPSVQTAEEKELKERSKQLIQKSKSLIKTHLSEERSYQSKEDNEMNTLLNM
jgi:hypothetical protein